MPITYGMGRGIDMVNYYSLLEISEDASAGIVRAAYKVQEEKCYPNAYGSQAEKEEATQKLKLLHEALDILTDPDARRKYDDALKGQTDANIREDLQDRLLVEVQSMVISAKDEVEYLALHQTISDLDIPAQQKSCMHTILDRLTAVRLEKELASAKELKNYQKEVNDVKLGMALGLIIGALARLWFPYAFLIGLAYAVLCYLGGKEDRKKLADAQQAEQHIMLYCQHGFRIW